MKNGGEEAIAKRGSREYRKIGWLQIRCRIRFPIRIAIKTGLMNDLLYGREDMSMSQNRAVPPGEVSGFLRAEGRKLVNGEGREVLLRGVGFGSWLLPEGYMWAFPDQGDRPRRIERMVEELVGADLASEFWDLYYDRYVREADIRRIAEEGFNSVRVPINARFLMEEEGCWKEERLALIDRVVGWCREHRLYVILDLHGAPGGQTGTNIDDSEFDRPDLFLEERYADLTVELWRMLAARYKDEWIVGGYDLLNEPLPNWFAQYNDRIMPLYKRIASAIREADDRHMIILEGAHWSTDWTIFDERIDDNVMLQFHKYWNNPDTESIQAYLDGREKWNAPIFMGEGGENNKDWYAGAFRLFEDHGISWNFWTWKKLERDNSPCSVRRPCGWELLVAYLEGGEKPEPDVAQRVLWTYLDNLLLENCDYCRDVVDSLLRRPPARIPAVFYGYGGEGVGYGFGGSEASSDGDKDCETNSDWPGGESANEDRSCEANRESPGEASPGAVGFRSGDGTDIRFASDAARVAAPNFGHGRGEPWQPDEWLCVQLAPGDWLAYDFLAQASEPRPDRRDGSPPESASFSLTLRLSAVEGETCPSGTDVRSERNGGGMSRVGVRVTVDGRGIGFVPCGLDWEDVRLPETIRVAPGTRRIVLSTEGGPLRVMWLALAPASE